MPDQPAPHDNLWHLVATELAARRPVAVATIVRDAGSVPRRTGAKMLVHPDGTFHGTVGGGIFELLVIRDAVAAIASARSVTRNYSFNPKGVDAEAFGAVCGGRAEVFLEVVMPQDRLIIVGGGHCGRALARAAGTLDFSVVVADDRAEFARPADFPFPNVERVLHSPADFRDLPEPDPQTYVVLVSKGFLTDEAALRRVIHSPAAYIGMIGSLRKRAAVYDKLKADGITDAQLARVHAPIGLEIGADTPEEIAVSILAEVIQVRAERRRQAAANADAHAQP
jgi:xanthine dehydrogenase accessory factor